MNWQQAALAVFVGAVIGYVTNWIAIRMLFRPRREIKIMGFHVPFTPGVIPRGKKRLAGSVGRVVGGMLLTGENVTRHLLRPPVEEQVRGHVNNRVEEWRERGATLAELLDAGGDHNGAAPVRDELARLLAGAARGLLSDAETRRPLARFAAGAAHDLLDRPVGLVTEWAGFPACRDFLRRLSETILDPGYGKPELHHRLTQRVENFLNSPEPLGSYMPEALREGMHQFITDQTPRFLSALEQYLDTPEAHQAIRNRIEDFFEGTALKRLLNGVFQLAGSGADIMVARLAKETTLFLADEKNRVGLEERLHKLVDEALEKSVAETAALDADARREKAAEIAAWALERIQRPNTLEPLLEVVQELLDANRHLTWREFLRLDELDLPGSLEDHLDRLLQGLAEREEGARILDDLSRRAVGDLWHAPVGRVLALLPAETAGDPGKTAVNIYRYVVRTQVPALLQFFDVTGMVRQQVEELDVLQVEEMVLGIVRRELVAITWLGGLLGALLGLAMVGMQHMMR
ncbi:MAG: DUF445 domain-containing protein [Firmicutes bacterium]|nr:DUF445 domain-containing protein [Bacillota bacterium]